MPDREVRYRIVGDASGAVSASKEATAGNEKFTQSTEEAGKHTELFTAKGREMHKLLHEISAIAPGAGLLLRAAFHPQNIGIVALVSGIKLATSAMEEYEQKLKEVSEKAAKPFMEVNGIIENSIDAIHRAITAHQEWANHVESDSKRIDAALEQRLATMKATMEAIKKLTGKDEPSSIESTGRHAEISIVENALRQAQAALTKATANEAGLSAGAIGARDPEKLKTASAADAAEAGELRKKAAEAQSRGDISPMKEFGYQILNAISFTKLFGYGGIGDRLRQNRVNQSDAEDLRLTREANEFARRGTHESNLSAQSSAENDRRGGSQKTAQANVKALEAQVESLQHRLATLRSTTGITDIGDARAGKPISDPIAAVLSRGAAGLASAHPGDDDKQATAALAKMLSALHMNLPKLVNEIRAHANDFEWLAGEVEALKRQANAMRGQIKSRSLNQGG